MRKRSRNNFGNEEVERVETEKMPSMSARYAKQFESNLVEGCAGCSSADGFAVALPISSLLFVQPQSAEHPATEPRINDVQAFELNFGHFDRLIDSSERLHQLAS